MSITGNIYGINGPIITIKGNLGFKMSEMVYVGKNRLVGEVIGLNREETTIQVFEETTGLRPGELVEGASKAISVTLAPGKDRIMAPIFRVVSMWIYWIKIVSGRLPSVSNLKISSVVVQLLPKFQRLLLLCIK